MLLAAKLRRLVCEDPTYCLCSIHNVYLQWLLQLVLVVNCNWWACQDTHVAPSCIFLQELACLLRSTIGLDLLKLNQLGAAELLDYLLVAPLRFGQLNLVDRFL